MMNKEDVLEIKEHEEKTDFTYLLDCPLALEALCKLFDYGAKKYARTSWRTLDSSDYTKAMLRHLIKESTEKVDEETGMPHVIATAWNALVRLELYLMEEQVNYENKMAQKQKTS